MLNKRQEANQHQVAGTHYQSPIQHWDFVLSNNLGYLEGQITRYITRHRKKNGLEDLLKARHYLDKLIEVETERAQTAVSSHDPAEPAGRGYVDQD